MQHYKITLTTGIMIKKIWNDPVLSKVISTGILLSLTAIISWISSLLNHISFMDNWNEVINTPLIWIIIAVFTLIIIYPLFRKKKFKYDEVSLNQDKLLLNQIITKDLPTSFFDDYFRSYDFGGSFLREHLNPLMDFEYIRKNPQYEFNNPTLENIKKELLSNISSFKDHIVRNTIVNEYGVLKVLDAIKEDDKLFISYKNTAHSLANKICNDYDTLIRTMRSQRVGS